MTFHTTPNQLHFLTTPAKYIPAGVQIVKRFYADGNVCLSAIDKDGSPFGILSVNIPETELDPEYVWIKDWSENEGVLNALVESNLVTKLNVTRPCGYAEAHLVRLDL
jgi:hypothetical protein